MTGNQHSRHGKAEQDRSRREMHPLNLANPDEQQPVVGTRSKRKAVPLRERPGQEESNWSRTQDLLRRKKTRTGYANMLTSPTFGKLMFDTMIQQDHQYQYHHQYIDLFIFI